MPFISSNGPTSLKISKYAPRGHREEPQDLPPTGPHMYNKWVRLGWGVTSVGPVMEYTLAKWGHPVIKITRKILILPFRNKESGQSDRFCSIFCDFERENDPSWTQKTRFFVKVADFRIYRINFNRVKSGTHMIIAGKRHYISSSAIIFIFP